MKSNVSLERGIADRLRSESGGRAVARERLRKLDLSLEPREGSGLQQVSLRGLGLAERNGGLDSLKLRILAAGNEMPVAPRILAEVGQKMQEMEAGLEELASLLKLDAGITSVVLRVANTAAYNPHEAFVAMEDALARLGFAKAYRLVGIAAVKELSDQNLEFFGISGAELRQNALFTGLVAELISQISGACPQGAYTAGLLRSIGKAALDRIAQRSALRWEGVIDEETELQLFGLDGWQASAMLLEAWGFPGEIVRGMREMSEPEPAERLAEVLQLAAGLAERAGYGLRGEFFGWALAPEKLEFLGLTGPAVEEVVRKATKQFLAVRGAIL